jgi:hypothetical protein
MGPASRALFSAALLAATVLACSPSQEIPPGSFGGDPLDSAWKRQLHARMSNGFLGTRGDLLRAEARYAAILAERSADTELDRDVLFAAILLQHARHAPGPSRGSALLADAVLLPLGFPPQKLPAVRELLVRLERDCVPTISTSGTAPADPAAGG